MYITAKDISVSFRKKGRTWEVLKSTSIEVLKNKITVISGRSGSGKTTLINVLSGLLAPTAGTVKYEDKGLYRMNDGELSSFRNRHIGFIPQGHSLLEGLTVKENILFPHSEETQAAGEIIKKLGLEELADKYPNSLSGGEARRTAIARALIGHPDVVFADEPTNDLDDENAALVMQLFKDASSQGTSVVIVTHEPSVIEYADILYKMDNGEIRSRER